MSRVFGPQQQLRAAIDLNRLAAGRAPLADGEVPETREIEDGWKTVLAARRGADYAEWILQHDPHEAAVLGLTKPVEA